MPGSTYVELPRKLKNSVKGLNNIKIHIRHLNPLEIHLEKITKAHKNIDNNLDYEGIKFPVSKKNFGKIEKKNNIFINEFCYGNNMVYPIYVSSEKFENCLDLSMITDENKSNYVYTKKFMCKKCKNKKHVCKYCYNVLVAKGFWQKIEERV